MNRPDLSLDETVDNLEIKHTHPHIVSAIKMLLDYYRENFRLFEEDTGQNYAEMQADQEHELKIAFEEPS